MPKVAKQRSSGKLIHPNSRQANHLSRQKYKQQQKQTCNREKASKLDAKVRKFLWFQDNMDKDLEKCSNEEVEKLVEKYLCRFNDELEQIEIIRSVGKRNATQHSSRERIIKFQLDQEKMLFKTSGIELPDLLNVKAVKEFEEWDGDAKLLPRLKTIKFRKQSVST